MIGDDFVSEDGVRSGLLSVASLLRMHSNGMYDGVRPEEAAKMRGWLVGRMRTWSPSARFGTLIGEASVGFDTAALTLAVCAVLEYDLREAVDAGEGVVPARLSAEVGTEECAEVLRVVWWRGLAARRAGRAPSTGGLLADDWNACE